jgi:membrane protein
MMGFKKLLRSIWKKSNEDLLFTHSAALTYYTFVYTIPIFALFYFFFAYFNGFEKVSHSIQSLIGAYLAPQLAESIMGYIETIQKEVSAKTVGIFGLIGFVISSGLMLYQIEFAFNAMLGKDHPHHRIKRMLKYALLMTTGPIFIGLSILTQQAVYKLNQSQMEITILSLFVSIMPLVSTVIFMSVLYKWVSAIRLSWRTCLLGGIFSGIGVEILKQLYAFYVVYSLKQSLFGALIVLPLFLFWVNLIWTIVLLGGQICCYLHGQKQEKLNRLS